MGGALQRQGTMAGSHLGSGGGGEDFKKMLKYCCEGCHGFPGTDKWPPKSPFTLEKWRAERMEEKRDVREREAVISKLKDEDTGMDEEMLQVSFFSPFFCIFF